MYLKICAVFLCISSCAASQLEQTHKYPINIRNISIHPAEQNKDTRDELNYLILANFSANTANHAFFKKLATSTNVSVAAQEKLKIEACDSYQLEIRLTKYTTTSKNLLCSKKGYRLFFLLNKDKKEVIGIEEENFFGSNILLDRINPDLFKNINHTNCKQPIIYRLINTDIYKGYNDETGIFKREIVSQNEIQSLEDIVKTAFAAFGHDLEIKPQNIILSYDKQSRPQLLPEFKIWLWEAKWQLVLITTVFTYLYFKT